MACMAISTLMMLAGPMPAVRVPRGDDVAGVEVGHQPRLGGDVVGHRWSAGRGTMPQPASASPPSGLAGTGSGCGGSPALGTSEESTAGGVDTRYGHAFTSGAAFGSAAATGTPTSAGAASIASAATWHKARRGSIREVAIVCAE